MLLSAAVHKSASGSAGGLDNCKYKDSVSFM